MLMDFLADLKRLAETELSALGFTGKPADDLDSVLVRYHNVKSRIPRRVSWTVLRSTEVSKKLSGHTLANTPQDIEAGMRKFICKAENGDDLKPHLSTKIADPDYQDLMFYDWGTYHFHLGTQRHPKRLGFVARTNELLFAMTHPQEDKMYLVDIHPHAGAFENQDLIRVVESDWPEILSVDKIKGISVERSEPRSDEDVKKDRKSGLNPLTLTPNGDVLAPPGGGTTTACTSAANQLAADKCNRHAIMLQQTVKQDRPSIEERFKREHNLAWNDLDIQLTDFVPSFAVTEIRTGVVLGYWPLPSVSTV